MKVDLYHYKNYRQFLAHLLETEEFGRGARAHLARALGCGNSFISQVLGEKNHLSLEQGQRACAFLSLNPEEQNYFLILIQYERAGTKALSEHFLKQIELLQEKNKIIQERIAVKTGLTPTDQMTYYSSWIYGAIHVLVSVPDLRTKAALSEHLQLPLSVISEALDFLVSIGLVIKEGNQFEIGKTRIHLGKDSPILSRHHANWRMQALQSIDKKTPEALHFSSVMALSPKEAEKIKTLILDSVTDVEEVLKDATEQGAYCLGIDFFEIMK